MSTLMGYEGKLWANGTTGSDASAGTLITTVRDVNIEYDPQMGDTSSRGDGSAVPQQSERVVQMVSKISFQTINQTTDTIVQTLLTKHALGAPVALRTKDYASGKGFDGDVNLKCKIGQPYKGEQTLEWECTPNNESREPQPYV